MSFGTFCLIKNEIPWIAGHLISWLPHVDEMCFFDGNSTDGTLEVLKDFKAHHTFGHKITLVEDMDPKDLKDDYVRLSNECLHTLKTDYCSFIHPDMILDDPGKIKELGANFSYFTTMRSFAGDPGGQLYEILIGRGEIWKNIYRLRNPDLGLHYFGHYGAGNEDCYFSKITGNEHAFHVKQNTGGDGQAKGIDLVGYPYAIGDSGIKISHFSDVRTYKRRFERMKRCLINQGHSEDGADIIAKNHPRVTFENKNGFAFVPAQYPAVLMDKGMVNV